MLRLAALLHDVGHAPFSHAAEGVIHKDSGHEELSYRIVAEEKFLGTIIDQLFYQGCAKSVGKIIKGPPALEPQLQVLKDIVSGEMDADRTDYLLRDSLHCGVEYGSFDHERMIESLRIVEGDGGTLEMALDRGGLHTVEALILARYQMNSQVYYHRIRRIYDFYLSKYFENKEGLLSTEYDIMNNDDVTMFAEIKKDAKGKSPASKWAKRIVNRDHHREIHATGETTNAQDKKTSQTVFSEMQKKFSDIDFVADNTGTVKIHKFLLPTDMEDQDWIQLQIVDKGKKSTIGEQSHVLKNVPRFFQIARIFADVSPNDIDKRKELVTFASNKYREHVGH